eukprot:TRINITY_DN4561_c0_g1_i1.p1 TRINITY_DN4561_c0_g1~~TRINITY_DN4561_c0_g1_i1.p1  ORF type:complete len:1071 (-),score=304.52 TRINITY_DN4561_c0_g1_i1:362-3409(-)
MSQVLSKFRVKTVSDLSQWKHFQAAKAISELEPEGPIPAELQEALDKSHRSKAPGEVLELKPSALMGLSVASDKALSILGLRTVGQIAEYKYARWAAQIVELAGPAAKGLLSQDQDDDPLAGEDDVWNKLDQEMQEPPADVQEPSAASAEASAGKLPLEGSQSAANADDDSDDDWGIEWKGKAQQPKTSDELIKEIQKEVSKAAGFEKEEWQKKETDDDEDEAEWGAMFKNKKEEEVTAVNWQIDESWNEKQDIFESNSNEALGVQNVVRKIRSRTKHGELTGAKDSGEFPSEDLTDVVVGEIGRTVEDQRRLLAALLWVEAQSLERAEVPPNLSQETLKLYGQEDAILRAVSQKVPTHSLIAKASAPIPSEKLREDASQVVIELISKLRQTLSGSADADNEKDAEEGNKFFKELFEEVAENQPHTVRIMTLVHTLLFAKLMRSRYNDLEMLAVAFAKQCLLERAIEVVCRVSLAQAVGMAATLIAADKETEELLQMKADSLNRLSMDWRMNPEEDDLAQIHTLALPRQLQVLLSIERDIELFWHKLPGKVKDQEEQGKALKEYLNFQTLLRPYMSEKDLLGKGAEHFRRVLESESGIELTTLDIAKVKCGVSEVLMRLFRRYGWRPELRTRREISRVNWVGRLSALLALASKSNCLHADQELRRLLYAEGCRKLNMDVYHKFLHWQKLNTGENALKLKRIAFADAQKVQKMDKMFKDFEKDGTRFPGQGYQPRTPANLGQAPMTAMPGMTPGGNFAPATPGFAPQPEARPPTPQWRPPQTPLGPSSGTPAWPPGRAAAGTPAGLPPAAGTPAGLPPASGTPANFPPGSPARLPPGTPAGAPPGTPGMVRGLQPGTPAGAPPPTPGMPRQFQPGTPAGLPPASGTPGAFRQAAAGTPAGMPPMTPGFAGGPKTPGGIHTPTKDEAGSVGPVPRTPADAFTPNIGAGSVKVPQTPKAEGEGTPGVPMTPAGAMPFTPRPAAGTPGSPGALGGAVPFTPAGAGMPQTPAGAPNTPAQ